MPWCGCMWKLVGFKASKVSTKMNYGILVLKTRKRLLCVWLSQERRKLVEWTTNRCEKWSLGNLITKRLRFMTGPRKSMMRLVQQKHILCSFYLHIFLGNRSNNIGNYFDGTTFTAPDSGLYSFCASCTICPNQWSWTYINVNCKCKIQATLRLQKDDKVEVRFYGNMIVMNLQPISKEDLFQD